MFAKLTDIIASDIDADVSQEQLRWFVQACGVFAVLLVVSTWHLWVPQDVFPQVPFVRIANKVPEAIELCLLGVMLSAACVWSLPVSAKLLRTVTTVFLISTVALILIDQHRLQPWAYHLLLLAIAINIGQPRGIMAISRLLLVSIFFFSATSKFDHQFVHTLGQQFIETLCNLVGLTAIDWPQPWRIGLGLTFPMGELLVAIGLVAPRTRRCAAILAITMHCVLILVLGPWGLKHHLGVIIWNLFFIAQILLLYLIPKAMFRRRDRAAVTADPTTTQERFARAITIFVAAAPLLEPFGLIDHWPAWQLYAPRNSRVTMNILEREAARLPNQLQTHLRTSDEGLPWVRLDLDAWSLTSLGVPIYPQDRFQLGIALAVAGQFELGGAVRVEAQGVASRLTGNREQRILRGRDDLVRVTSEFRLNAIPRSKSIRCHTVP